MADPTSATADSATAAADPTPSDRGDGSRQSLASAFESMPAGRTWALPRSRRLVNDLLAYWRHVPAVSHYRRLHIPTLAATRSAAMRRISWPVLFMKAHALVAAETPELRRLYLGWPYPRLYEHPTSACRMTVSREIAGDNAVLMSRTFDVEAKSLAELDDEIRYLATAPLEEIDLFQRQIRFSRVPTPLRRLAWWVAANFRGPMRVNFLGTFMVTTVSKWGGVSLTPPVISNATLSFGPVESDNGVDVYLIYDHRVFDGALNAQAMVRLEEILETTIAEELASLQPAAD